MNRLSRLTALLLALLMLFSSTGLAEAAAGIAFDDFNATAFYSLKQSANDGASDDADTADNANTVDADDAATDTNPNIVTRGSVDLVDKIVQTTEDNVWIYKEAVAPGETLIKGLPKGTLLEVLGYIPGDANYYSEFYFVRYTDTDGTVFEGYVECRQTELYVAPTEPEECEKTDTTDDGTTVTVSGSMPANVTLEVARASASDIAAVVPSASTIQARNVVLDITLVDQNDDVWQPEKAVTVTVNAPNLGAEGDTIVLFHIHGTQVEHIGETEMDADGDITFTMNKFSYIYAVNACDEEGCILEALAKYATAEERYTRLTTDYDFVTQAKFFSHYRTKHSRSGLLCSCTSLLPPAADGHVATCAWHKDMLYPPVSGEIDGTSVSVSGKVPAGVTMTLSAATSEQIDAHLPGLSATNLRYLALDITPMLGGSAWQPGEGNTVDVTISVDYFGSNVEKLDVFHHHNGVTTELGACVVEDGKITFTLNGFSCVYVVDSYSGETCWIDELAGMETAEERSAFLKEKQTASQGVFDTFTFHYRASHLSEKLICDCDIREFKFGAVYYEPWTSEHTQSDCPWHPNNKPTEPENTTISNNGVSVTGNLPAGTKVALGTVDVDAILAQLGLNGMLNKYTAYDVSLKDANDAVWQPTDTVTVTMKIKSEVAVPRDRMNVYHVHTENGTQTYEIIENCTVDSNGAITFNVDKFSVLLAVNMNVDGGVVEAGDPITPPLPEQPELGNGVYTYDTVEGGSLSEGTVSVELPKSGKTTLTVAQDGGQWQVLAGEIWANIPGETGTALDVTAAMVAGIGTSAQFRWISADGESESEIATIRVIENSAAQMMYAAAPASAEYALSAAAEGDENANLTYNVVVKYVVNGSDLTPTPEAFNLAAGSNFTQKVKFPTVVGYLPYLLQGTEYVRADELNIDIDNIDQDWTYQVVYQPTNVEYTVVYYQQNATGDAYEQYEVKKYTGLTNSYIGEGDNADVAIEYTGFRPLGYEHAKIAADGSTTIEIYYDRIFTLLLFELSGGYGVEPIYARYGSAVGDIGTPERPGYTFLGWTDQVLAEGVEPDQYATIPTTMPAANTTYYAVWKMNDTAKVSVVFLGQNANDNGYSYLQTGVVEVRPGTEYTFADGNTVFMICGKDAHTHTDECTLACGKEEHTEHTEACLKCGYEQQHTHVLSCYQASGNYQLKTTSKPSDIVSPKEGLNEYTTGGGCDAQTTHYYLYLNGQWYCCYNGNTKADTQPINLVCTNNHTHSNSCYSCEIHEHTNDCYSCGYVEHTHNDQCDQEGSGLDPNLWTFVSSETKVVAADGSTTIEVKYNRKEFTITFKETGNNGKQLDTITARWGADIRTRFMNISNANTFLWSMKTSGDSPWTSFLDVMPAENRTYYAKTTTSSSVQTATYLVQKIGTTAGTTANYETLYTVNVKYGSGLTVSKEEYVEIEGYTFNSNLSTKTGSSFNGAKFYYDRNKYAIEFYNPVSLIKKVEGVEFDKVLTEYNWTPDASMAPSKYEPGSVVFAGWYQNPECAGEAYDFTQHQMPAAPKNGDTAVTLYAKWTPVNYKVTFYIDSAAYKSKTPIDGYADIVVTYGELIDPARVPTPTNGSYTFVTWVYEDAEGNKHAYSPENVPVKQDLHVYAEWSSMTLVEYAFYFKTKLDDGTVVDVAAPVTGSKYADGNAVTQEAKGGEELYSGYQTEYFPNVMSHSITPDPDNPEKNVYTFWYTKSDPVPYTVKYINKETGDNKFIVNGVETTVEPKIVNGNTLAVVTETFKVIQGYMPDAYQKRLVVVPGGTNEIIFYYTEDKVHAYYKVSHYTQNLDGTYTEQENWTNQLQGTIGETYTADPRDIDGFVLNVNHKDAVPSGELTENGLELKLYYDRIDYPYTIRYLEQGTMKVLKPEDTKNKAPYGSEVTVTPPNIENYTFVSQSPDSLTIRIEEDAEGNVLETAQLNILTLYYVENSVPLHYEVVGATGGTVKLITGDDTTQATKVTEEVKVLSAERAIGATATANPHYTFDGWYSDASCTTLITKDANYQPERPDSGVWRETTHYAKFVENTATINYVAVGPQGATNFGSVNPESETLGVVSGTATGSTATANAPTFKFVGWYAEAACTTLLSTALNYVPTKADGAVWVDGTTYYAKFEYNIADLTITKTISGKDANTADDVFTFNVTIPQGEYELSNGGTVTSDGTNPVQIQIIGEGSVTIKGIVITSAYTVQEVDLPTGYTIANETVSGSIAATGSTAAFTNVYQTGTLVVTKTVEGSAAPETAAFSFTVTLPNGTYKVDGVDTQVTDGTLTFTLAHGGSATITGIPAGAAYTVTEAANADYTTTKTGDTGSIVANGTQTAAFTNAYNYQNLTIKKVVKDSTFTTGEKTFTFDVAKSNGSTEQVTITVKAEDKADADKNTVTVLVPVGSTTVTEVVPTGYEATYSYAGRTNKTGAQLLITRDGNWNMTVINTANSNRDITITKNWVDNSDALDERPDAINVTLSGNGNSYTEFTWTKNGDQWTTSITVPKFDATGNEIT
ncbi:MAG: InlB B-repeat-containing protein, partial [Clostridia bacterium]|nr:InlB B-repeat-containing protein [Clostridia bacterium]